MTAVDDRADRAAEVAEVAEDGEGVVDFTSSARPVRFRVNGEDFEAVAELPAFTALELADRLTLLDDPEASADARADVIRALLRALLPPESADRFVARLNDAARPIGVVTFQHVLTWLLRRYGADPAATAPAATPEADRG